MLRLCEISKRWGQFAHRQVNLTVDSGEFFVLLGPSGAGKSLLLELIAGLARPDSGRIHINGVDVTALPPEKRNVGLVWQQQMLFPHMTAGENIAYGPKARGVGSDERRERVSRLAQILRVREILDRPVSQLSVGQRQRVALARAVAGEPDVLLLDEPFSSLDPPLKKCIWDEIKTLHDEMRLTTFHVTHDRAEALFLADRIAIINDGRVEQLGQNRDVFERPGSRFVAEFTGGTNIYEGVARAEGGLRRFTDGSLELISTSRLIGPCSAVVRPENIIISMHPVATSARNQVEGTVESVTRRGDVFEVAARFGSAIMTCVVTPQSVDQLAIVPGARVYFSFKAGSVHLFPVDDREQHDDLT